MGEPINLSEASERLKKASDLLNNWGTQMDKRIEALQFGVEAWVEIDDKTIFGYSKVLGRWGLTIMSANNDFTWLFNDAPRPLRLLCVNAGGTLLKLLGEKATQLAIDIERKFPSA